MNVGGGDGGGGGGGSSSRRMQLEWKCNIVALSIHGK